MQDGTVFDAVRMILLAAYFLLSPPALAWVIARLVRRRITRERGDVRAAVRRHGRWLGLPWLLYLVNVLAGGAYLAAGWPDVRGPGIADAFFGISTIIGALVPVLLLGRMTRRWERSVGHPAGRITLGVEARSWLAYVGLLVTALGSALLAVGMGAGVVGTGIAAAVIVAYLVFYPDLFRWIWAARPLPDGEDARRIRALLSRHGASVRGIFIIPSAHGASANAFMTGILDRRRVLFLTERLLEHLDPDEVDAVVAHEIGHLLRRHVLRAGIGMVVTAVLAATILFGLIALTFGDTPDAARTMASGLAGAGTCLSSLLVTRRMFRRFEFEADDFAARAVASGAPMARALRKLARENWLAEGELEAGAFASHPAIERRIRRLVRA